MSFDWFSRDTYCLGTDLGFEEEELEDVFEFMIDKM